VIERNSRRFDDILPEHTAVLALMPYPYPVYCVLGNVAVIVVGDERRFQCAVSCTEDALEDSPVSMLPLILSIPFTEGKRFPEWSRARRIPHG
jgi:hypothetical protein